MIKSYKEITNKYLIKNKNRTILTLVSVILSVALISSVGLFFKSMQAVEIENVKNSIGSWHIRFINPDDITITKVKSNPAVKRIGLYKEEQLKPIDKNLSFRRILVTKDSLELLPYKLKEGRYPTNNKEVAVEEWFKDRINENCRINEKIKIGNEEYKLVGTLENELGTQLNFAGDVITVDEIGSERILLVEMKNSKNMKYYLEQLKNVGKNVEENKRLLRALGAKLPPGYAVALGIIIAIVVISSMAVIYNSFQISVVNRVKEFGLLRAIGATPKQIRKIVFREATIISLIGIPIGLLCGIIALYGIDFVFKIISENKFNIIAPTISRDIISLSTVVGLLSVYGSAYLPSRYASKVSPLIAISSRFVIKKEKIKRRKSFLMYKLFGFEGLMAYKNIKRNKKRYRVTVFSISLSIMLFILFNFLVEMFLGMYNDMGEYKNLHFIVKNKSGNEKLVVDENIVNQIKSLPYIRDSYISYGKYFFNVLIDKTKENDDLKKRNNIYKEVDFNGEKKSSIETVLEIYDDNCFE
ncbi:MAG: ABC transporter permease [Caloramator sp.]|nr:ABC transporter permease [Caloramator sp.]